MKRIFLCTLLLSPFSLLQAEALKPKTLKEMNLSQKQAKELSSDLPAKAVVVDPFENIWFLGNNFLWKWIPMRNTLEQIKLLTAHPLKNLAVSGENVLVSDDEQIFQIESEPFKVISIPSPGKESRSLAIVGEATDVMYWIKSDGVYEISTAEKTLRKIYTHSVSESEDSKFLFFPENKTLWMTKNKELSYISYGDSRKPKKIGKIEKNITDIQKSHDDVFAMSQHSVFRYTKRAKLIQTIPVNPQRRIVLSSLQPSTHAYIFQDRLFEVHLPSDGKIFHFYLDIGRIHRAKTMSLRDSYLAIILDGNPRVFRFSNEIQRAL